MTKLLILLISFIAFSLSGQTAPSYDRFELNTLSEDLSLPMTMDILPDGKIVFVELYGKIRIFDPSTSKMSDLATLKINSSQESGLLGIVKDPNFEKNNWVYIRYSHPQEHKEVVSRFTIEDDKIDINKEVEIITFPIDRKKGNCCHKAGSLAFDSHGNLYISVGDNTGHAGESKGYAPLDERPGRDDWDSQRSSANSNSFVGGILRIKPKEEGSYSIPQGNLFPKGGTLKGRPEIYVKGCRNPWRISIDPKTNYLYWGEVGPDAGNDNPKKGPAGHDEVNQAKKAGFFGWPYFIADNKPYIDRDYVSGDIKGPFDPQNPVNDSPNNTGSQKLPPAQPAFIHYTRKVSDKYPMLGTGGRTACAGPVYHYDPSLKNPNRLPKYYDNCLFIYEWSRHWIMAVHLNEDSSIKKIEPFLKTNDIIRPIDIKFGPQGEMYVIQYGSTWRKNDDTKLLRIDYVEGNRPPKANITYKNNIGKAPLTVELSAETSSDKDSGDTLRFEWYLEGDSKAFSTDTKTTKTFNSPGNFNIVLKAYDSQNAVNQTSVPLIVGNSIPELSFNYIPGSGFYDWNENLTVQILAKDEEDGNIEKVKMKVTSKHELNAEPLGLRLMRKSDCFNCHTVDRKIVGPSFLEIAEKYSTDKEFNESVKRIKIGSVNVWGPAPMLPHPQHSTQEIQQMVKWIYTLGKEEDTRIVETGKPFTVKAPSKKDNKPIVNVIAEYTDKGTIGIGPLTGYASFMMRHKHVEAEKADIKFMLKEKNSHDAMYGNKSLITSANTSYIALKKVFLGGIKSIDLRMINNNSKTILELRSGSPDGSTIGKIAFTEKFKEFKTVKVPVNAPSEPVDLYLVFKTSKNAVHLNWIEFNK